MINVAFITLKDQHLENERTREEIRGWIECRVEENFVHFRFANGDTIWYNIDHVVEFNTSKEEE